MGKLRGIYGKYVIAKTDGSSVDSNAHYFVLRLDTDPAARTAALAYADACERSNPELAAGLRRVVRKFVSSMEESLDVVAGKMSREICDEIDRNLVDQLTNLPDIGQGQKMPLAVWLLFDKANGDQRSHRYCWFFSTRRQAREHKCWQEKQKHGAELAGPFRFECDLSSLKKSRKRSG